MKHHGDDVDMACRVNWIAATLAWDSLREERKREKERDGEGTEVGSRKRRINDIILPNPQ